MGWSDEVNLADEYFHNCSDDPYWSETSLLGFTAPNETCAASSTSSSGPT